MKPKDRLKMMNELLRIEEGFRKDMKTEVTMDYYFYLKKLKKMYELGLKEKEK